MPTLRKLRHMVILEGYMDVVVCHQFGFEWTATAFQEKLAGNASTLIFGLSLLLVYLVLAGQYESWITPISVLLAVPLALLGTVAVLTALGLANNLYTQIGLVLLIALAAKNLVFEGRYVPVVVLGIRT